MTGAPPQTGPRPEPGARGDGTGGGGEGAEAGEGPKKRDDRELIELLNELRVALPGVQVLFAFLLTVPFQQGFQHVSQYQRNLYDGTLLASAVSVMLLIAPAAQHRLLFRKEDKEPMLFRFNRYAVTGLLFLGLSLVGAIMLVTTYLFGQGRAIASAIPAALLCVGLWLLSPLFHRHR